MSLILQIETATSTCSVALSYEGRTIAVKEETGLNIHAGYLTLFIEQLLRDAGKSIREIKAVAVSKGPGSYTGLRIGVSAAKGLCYALDVPLIAVSTLKAMSAGVLLRQKIPAGTIVCAMLDARRMEVYTAVFDEHLKELVPVNALIVDQRSFAELLGNHRIIFFGDGAAKCEELIGHDNARFLDGFLNSAGDMSMLAFEKFTQTDFEDLAYFEPYYLKEFLFKSKAGS